MNIALILSKVGDLGIEIVRNIGIELTDDLKDTIKSNTYSNIDIVTCARWRKSFIYSKTFVVQYNSSKRTDKFNLHLITEIELQGIEDLLIKLAHDFEQDQLYKLSDSELDRILEAIHEGKNEISLTSSNSNQIQLKLNWK